MNNPATLLDTHIKLLSTKHTPLGSFAAKTLVRATGMSTSATRIARARLTKFICRVYDAVMLMKSPRLTENLSPFLAAEKDARQMDTAMLAENTQREFEVAERQSDRAAQFIAQMGLAAQSPEPKQN